MARIERTIFISYRRADVYTALAVYQNLSSKGYDVFFDYTSIPSGDFEQIIVSNIKARAHFLLILTPTALDRCSEPSDWLRREIETAIDEQRNIIPLFFKGFNFGSPAVAEKLTGKLGNLNRFNGLNVHEDYFQAAMDRLSRQFLSVPLDAILQPYSTTVREKVKEQQIAAENALQQRWKEIKEILKPAKEKDGASEQDQIEKTKNTPLSVGMGKSPNLRLYGIGASILLVVALGIAGINAYLQNVGSPITPTRTSQLATNTINVESSVSSPVNTAIVVSQTSTPTEAPTLTITPSPTLGIGSTVISTKDNMILMYVPAGEFIMGSTAEDALANCEKRRMTKNCQLDSFKDEGPPHAVYIDAFWIDQTEITNAMFAEFLNLNREGNRSEGGVTWLKSGSSDVRIHLNGDTWQVESGYEDHPVIEVSWYGARAYCSWVGRTLPTEAQWEKAASWDEKKQIKNVYPWGDHIECSFANFNDGSKQCKGKTTTVRSYPRGVNPYGVFDMAGNVWEWVNDWYDKDYYDTLVDSSRDPSGPSDGDQRVFRGGSWYSFDYDVRSSRRESSNPTLSSYYIGFRCALSE